MCGFKYSSHNNHSLSKQKIQKKLGSNSLQKFHCSLQQKPHTKLYTRAKNLSGLRLPGLRDNKTHNYCAILRATQVPKTNDQEFSCEKKLKKTLKSLYCDLSSLRNAPSAIASVSVCSASELDRERVCCHVTLSTGGCLSCLLSRVLYCKLRKDKKGKKETTKKTPPQALELSTWAVVCCVIKKSAFYSHLQQRCGGRLELRNFTYREEKENTCGINSSRFINQIRC